MKLRAFAGVSPVVDSWPLMSSPTLIVFILIGYLVFVLAVGPKLMKNKRPFDLTIFTRIYNVGQVLICWWFVKWSYSFGFSFENIWTCTKDSLYVDKFIEYKSVQWWFMMLRIAEIIETFVFVLRKKQEQVSTLHVFHHLSVALVVWIFVKYSESKPKKNL